MRRLVGCVVAVALIAFGLALGASAQFVILGSSFPTDAAQFYRITVEHSGLCLAVEGSQMMNGARVVQQSWLAASSELWMIQPVGTLNYRIVNLRSAKCLTVDTSPDGNWNIVQRVCLGGADQTWRIEPAGGQDFRIVNVISGRCLGVAGATQAEGAFVQALNPADGPHQLWRIEAAATQVYEPRSGSYLVPPTNEYARAYLGITCQVTAEPGVVVSSVAALSPADMADIRMGDIILAVDGQPITSCDDIERLITFRKPGDFIMVQIKRGLGSILLNVQLGWA